MAHKLSGGVFYWAVYFNIKLKVLLLIMLGKTVNNR